MIRFREADRADVPQVVALLRDDMLGQSREADDMSIYLTAFDGMQKEGGNRLIVGEDGDGAIVATYQITLISGLSLRAARRAQIDKWAEWAKLNVAMNFTVPVFWRVVRTPPAQRDGTAITVALAVLEDKLAIAEAQIANHGFLAGPAFTLADIQLGHVLYRYFDIDIPRADLPALAGYAARLAKRPAYREHVMVGYEDLRVE